MARTTTHARPSVPAATSAPPPSPPATRVPRRRWRDWRLLVGVLLVVSSAVAGARVVSAASDTVPVWAADGDLVPGTPLTPDDVRSVAVRLETSTNPYLTGPVPEGYHVVRDVSAGELLPRSAVAPSAQATTATRLVAVSLAGAVPGTLAPGDRVDVWVVPAPTAAAPRPDDSGDDPAAATPLAEGVTVASVPADDTGFGVSEAQESVVLRLGEQDAPGRDLTALVAQVVTASSEGRVVLTVDPAPR